jgi:hypothetical protein
MSEKIIDPSKGQFIDPMFAVVIAAAVAETIVVWVKGDCSPTLFQGCVVVLGYVNLLLSWFGYHKSVSLKPIKGSLRFAVTVVLLPLYLLTIILFQKDFINTALAYAAIFFLWSCWEYFKFIEYEDYKTFLSLQLRFFNIIVYLAAMLLYVVELLPDIFRSSWIAINAEVLTLSAIAFAIFLLRVVKSAGEGTTVAARISAEIRTLLFGEKGSSA